MKQTCFPEISNKLPLCLFNDFPLSKTEEIGIQKLFFFGTTWKIYYLINNLKFLQRKEFMNCLPLRPKIIGNQLYFWKLY